MNITTTKTMIINSQDFKGLGDCLDFACDYIGTGNNYQNDNVYIFSIDAIKQNIDDMQDNVEDDNLEQVDRESIELSLNTLQGIYSDMLAYEVDTLTIK